MPQSLINLHAHIVFSTKNREPYITPDLAQPLYDYMGGVVRNVGSVLVAAGGMPDHVHLLVTFGRQTCSADLVRDVKANSSRWVHESDPALSAFAWQNGYGAFGVSFSLVERVKRYIANQAEHHRTRTFQDEFRELLRKHDIAFDERYVWD